MTLKIPKIFGDISENEMKALQDDFLKLNENVTKFQHRNQRKNPAPIIKSSRYHKIGIS